MKKIQFLFSMLLMASALVFTSCNDDEPDVPPTVSFVENYTNGQTVTIESGNTINVKWIANKGSSQLATFSVIKDGAMYANYNNGSPRTLSGSNRDTYQDSVYISLQGNYEFRVTDNEGQTDQVSLNVVVQNDPGVTERTAVLMGAQGNATTGSFYDAEGNNVYLQAAAKSNAALVDLVYFYGATNLAAIAAPNDQDAGAIYNNATTGLQTWSVRNATKFKTTALTATEFNAITTSSAVASHASGGAATKVSQLATGNVFAFTTVGGKSGLVLVDSITTGSNGTITLKIKIQN